MSKHPGPHYAGLAYFVLLRQASLKKRQINGLVVHLSSTPLLRNGLVHVEDVCRHVVQVLTTKTDPADSTFWYSCFEQPPVTASHSFLLYLDAWYWRIIWYCDIHCDPFLSFKEICPHCPSCCFMDRIFGQMSPPLMDGWTSEMSCETVQFRENTFLKVAKWPLTHHQMTLQAAIHKLLFNKSLSPS